MDKRAVWLICMFITMGVFLFVLHLQNGKTISSTQALFTAGLGLGWFITAVGSIAALLERHMRRR